MAMLEAAILNLHNRLAVKGEVQPCGREHSKSIQIPQRFEGLLGLSVKRSLFTGDSLLR